jgi:hypothetical protein
MAANKKINITELDFDAIKVNLKEFLKGQSEFSDYDFEGSGLSVILDILAYNTHYNALYDNLAVNELFLDSAIKRNSVVSLAKSLGYTPRSAKCAIADVNVQLTTINNGPAVIVIPALSPFSTTIDGTTFTFYNRSAISATGPSTVYQMNNIRLTEGEFLSFRFDVAEGNTSRFIIPNQNVDLETLRVRVQENSQSSEFNTFTSASSLVDADLTTRVYWVKEIDDGIYELVFGDGVIGQALQAGNVVNVEYFVSSLDAPNGARVFTYDGTLPIAGSVVTVNVVNPASGGDAPEDIHSIKFNAPRMYAAQNRAVTTDDYTTILYNQFSEAKSVTVWGGEDNNPPVYGKTFICIRPKSANKLTNQQKNDVVNTILSNKNVVSVIPEILDPEYLNIAIDCTVYYNPRETTRSTTEIEELVRETIFKYDDDDLQRFDGVFRHSKLSRLIDMTETSIVNNNTTVLIRRQIAPRYNVRAQYLLNIVNPIFTTGVAQNAISTTGFFINGSERVHYLDDDGVGNIRLYYIGSSAEKIIVDPSIGEVDYAAGIINIKNLYITAIADIDLEISIRPSSYDVVSAYTQIAEVARDHLTITAIPDETANGDLRAGRNYQFTTSRS